MALRNVESFIGVDEARLSVHARGCKPKGALKAVVSGLLILSLAFMSSLITPASALAQSATLYPVTTQSPACTIDTVLYSETFDDGSDGGYAGDQSLSFPVGFNSLTNNIGNIDGSMTDVTIHPLLNGGAGAPSPSGGGFIGAIDGNSGEPTWAADLGGVDWSSAYPNGGVSFEFWNYFSGVTNKYNDKFRYFQIVGTSSKLILDLDMAANFPALAAGEWVAIDAFFDPSNWLYQSTTHLRTDDVNWTTTAATTVDMLEVLSNVQKVVVAPESGGGGNVNFSADGLSLLDPPGGAPINGTERYAADTIRAFSCTDVPFADDDEVTNLAVADVTIDVLGNDGDVNGDINPMSVVIVSDPLAFPAGTTITNGGKTFTVPGEGVWTVNSTTGAITFEPEMGFNDDPTPISYTVDDDLGNTSNPATVTVDYLLNPSLAITKVADNTNPVSGQTVTYTYTVTNDGEVDIEDVVVTDTHPGAGTLGAMTVGTLTNISGLSADDGLDSDVDLLAPGDFVTFTAEYSVLAADEGTMITNTAIAGGDPTVGTLNLESERTATATIDVQDFVENFVLDTSNGNQCTDLGGTLTGGNLFTPFDNGSLGFAADATPSLSPATNPFGVNLTGATYNIYPNTGFGEFSIVSNIQTARNRWQHGNGIFDPVNGVAGRFFHIDPQNFTEFPAVTLSGLIPGEAYEVSFWVADAELNAGNVSRVSILADGATVFSTPNIDNGTANNATMVWTKHSFVVSATGPTLEIIIRIVDENLNAITNGSGRDIHFDELNILKCDLPGLQLTKSFSSIDQTQGVDAAATDVGDVITYAFDITNTGINQLFDTQITDPLLNGGAPFGTSAADCVEGAIPSPLQPGDTFTCTSTHTYTLTQADFDAGGVENSAEAEAATSPGGSLDVTDVSDTGTDSTGGTSGVGEAVETDDLDKVNGDNNDGDPTNDPTPFALPQTPGIELEKTADTSALSTVPGVGDVITFTFEVSNTGNLALAPDPSLIASDTMNLGADGSGAAVSLDAAPVYVSGDTDTDGLLDLEETWVYSAEFTLTQDAIDAGGVHNTATASGNPVDQNGNDIAGLTNPTDVSDNDATGDGDDATSADPNGNPTSITFLIPEFELVKSVAGFVDSNGSGALDAGDTVTFEFTATNTGDTSLDDFSVTDAGLTPITITPVADVALAPGDGPTTIATATYVLTAADVANGGVENTATADATPVQTDASGNPIPGTSVLGPNGDTIGPVSDTSDAGTEPTIDPTTGLPADVTDPAGTETEDLAGGTDGDDGNDPTVLIIPAPGIEVVKSVASVSDENGNGFTDVGDEVTFTFEVSNTGNTDLEDVTITDGMVTVSGGPIDLPVGGSDTMTFTATYTLDADDIAAGGIENSAEASGTAVDEDGNPYGDPFDPGAPLTVADTSDAGTDPDGDPVTGNELVETEGLDGTTDTDPTNDPTVFLIEPAPMIEVLKSIASINDANGNGIIDVDDEVLYTFEVTNTGNVDLADVMVTDDLVTVSGGPIALDIGDTDTTSFTATYTIDADDVAAGGVENTADVTGNAVDAAGNEIVDPITGETLTATDDSDSGTEPQLDSDGNPIEVANPDTTESEALDGSTDSDPTNDPTVLFIPNPELTVVKSVANVLNTNGSVDADGVPIFGDEGDEIVYSFTVTNTGNVDLVGVTVSDSPAVVSGGPIDLDVGAGDSLTFTASYFIEAADVAAGFVENSATASGDAVDASGDPIYGPGGDALSATDVSDTGTDADGDSVTDPESNETDSGFIDATDPDGDTTNDPTVIALPTDPNPKLSLIKSVASVADTSGDGLIGEGDTVTYSFSVTNTGNVALAGITVSDDLATVSGGPIDLAIGETDTTTFTATAVISADQAAAGAIENTAEANGTAVNSAGDPIVDPETNEPYTATDTSDSGTEPEIDASGTPTAYADPEGNETPGADGSTDTDPTNDPTVLFLPMPEVTIVKSVASVADTNGNGFTDAGDTLTYTFDVSNTGNTDLANVAVTDALPGIVITGSPIASIAQGDTDSSVTATYVLTADDVAANGVENTAVASGTAVDSDGDPLGDPFNPGEPLTVSDDSDAGTDPDGNDVADPGATETEALDGSTDGDLGNDPTVFLIEPAPAIDLVKSIASINDLDGDGLPGVGDEVVYSFTVTNVGNVDLADVTVADPLGTVTGGPIDLGLGESDSATFEMVYELTAGDVAAGAVENTATASGTAVDAGGEPFVDPITGGPLLTTDTSDTGTEPEVGSDGLPADIADPAATESPDADGATDSDPTNDPTVLVLPNPELTVVKSIANVFDTNGDGLFGGEGDEVTYQFTVTNTGNVDIHDITLTDNIATVSGGPIDLAAGVGDSLSFTASYIISAADFAAGYIENTAEAGGNAVNGNGDPLLDLNGDPIVVTDTSDTGTDPEQNDVTDPAGTESDPGIDGPTGTDGDLGNDPTVTLIPAAPRPDIEIIKSIASVTDNGDGALGAGDTVTYSFTVTNTGNVDLADVTVSDPLVEVSGSPIALAIGESDSTTFTATYELSADDVAAGGVENTATADGFGVNSAGDRLIDPLTGEERTATDDSDTGTEPEMGSSGTPQTISDPAATESPDLAGGTDTDPTNDPTVLFIPNPGISIVKSLASAPDSNGDGVFGGVGDVLNYSFTVTNTGNTDLADIVVLDPTASVSGGPIDLAVGEADTTSFTATYMVTAADLTAGFVENVAEALGNAMGSDGNPLGNPVAPGEPITVSDTSDTGTDPTGGAVSDPETTESVSGITGTTPSDGDPTNDPTVVQIPLQPEPEIEIIKSVANVVDTDGDAVLGGEDDTVTYQFDVINTGNTGLADVEVNDAMLGGVIGTIPFIAVGDTATFTFDYVITEADQAAGVIENTATADGDAVNENGDPLLDPSTGEQLTASDDSDTGTDSSADPVSNPGLNETPDAVGGTDGDPTNDPTILNVPLAVPDTGVSGVFYFDENQDGALDGGDTLLAGIIVQIVDEDGNIIATTVTDENGFYEMTGFPIGTHDIQFVDPSTGEVVGEILGLSFERNTVLSDQNGLLDAAATPDQLVLTKTTPLSTAVLGGTVPYTITIENASALPVTSNIVDTLPVGMLYLPDSAILDGAAVEPAISGQSLTWTDVTLAAGASVTLELVARVGPNAPVGDLTNRVQAFDGDGNPLSPPALATVRRNPEAVFDCSDVVGKVFDDRNFDGYQSGPGVDGRISTRGHDITNQTYYGGKGVVASSDDEPGLPNVRLVTPTGTIITTDEHGRYSVPCAELPGGMGANFTLKLDTRSLPTGYRVTTENPRSMRVTAGIMTEMNFGASLGRVIDIDLTAAAFDADNDPVARLDQGLVRVLQQVAQEPSVLRISYFSAGEDRRDINQRLDKLESLINARWRNIGDYRLIVERDVKYLQ